MANTNEPLDNLRQTVSDLLDETFEKVHGYYLDKYTSLLETLEPITAAEASVPVSESGAGIAGHVEHVRFYLAVLADHIHGKDASNIDWEQSWLVNTVTADEWDALRSRLRGAYKEVRGLIEGFDTWEGENDVSGALAVIVHTAYHLGAIRLGLFQVQSCR